MDRALPLSVSVLILTHETSHQKCFPRKDKSRLSLTSHPSDCRMITRGGALDSRSCAKPRNPRQHERRRLRMATRAEAARCDVCVSNRSRRPPLRRVHRLAGSGVRQRRGRIRCGGGAAVSERNVFSSHHASRRTLRCQPRRRRIALD